MVLPQLVPTQFPKFWLYTFLTRMVTRHHNLLDRAMIALRTLSIFNVDFRFDNLLVAYSFSFTDIPGLRAISPWQYLLHTNFKHLVILLVLKS